MRGRGGGLDEDKDGGVGGLRGLICHFLATNALVLSLDERFMDLLAEGGQLVKDFFRYEVQMQRLD